MRIDKQFFQDYDNLLDMYNALSDNYNISLIREDEYAKKISKIKTLIQEEEQKTKLFEFDKITFLKNMKEVLETEYV